VLCSSAAWNWEGVRPAAGPAVALFALISGVSGIAWERRQTTRTPAGPTSRASERENASTAAHAGAAPPIRRAGIRPGTAVNVTITPEPWSLIRRAAAVAVMKFELV
jgi:hypothetical protein